MELWLQKEDIKQNNRREHKMGKILIFAGTTEGRKLAEFLNAMKKECFVSVATEYGKHLIPTGTYIETSSKRLTIEEMQHLIIQEQISDVIDATHPFAVLVSKNIKIACEKTNKKYIRLLREAAPFPYSDCILVDSIKEAADFLVETKGNILVTTGSKEIKEYTRIPNYKERITVRTLPIPEVIKALNELGLEGKNLICMQGPFCEEFNYSLLKQIKASYLVTKESGKTGGFLEKYNAAKRAGAKVILIGRPKETDGYSLEEIKAYLCGHIEEQTVTEQEQRITFVGIGMGTKQTMTLEAWEACEKADVLIGAKRVLKAMEELKKEIFISYQIEQIKAFIEKNPQLFNIVIAVSGDVGFYSGTKKWMELLKKYPIRCINGISSVVYFCGKLQMPWEQVKLVSLHGRKQNIIQEVKEQEMVFSLIGEKNGINRLCEAFVDNGLRDVFMYVGENLSYHTERITTGTPTELKDKQFDSLSVVLIHNEKAKQCVITHGIKDEQFLRDKIPMTKSEIRSISLSKLQLTKDSIIYDVGAGTGSVAIEMAIQAKRGIVYAVEQKAEAVRLLEKNKRHIGIENLQIIEGKAPEALIPLLAPTHIFIGGSSGNLLSILKLCLEKNPRVHIVINAITLETLAEALKGMKELPLTETDIVAASISKSREIGDYHMMTAQNPVYIITCKGKV